MKEVEIEAVRPFNRTPQGDICDVGDVFPVAVTRADELIRLGLARLAEKAAPVPANSLAPPSTNKTGNRQRVA